MKPMWSKSSSKYLTGVYFRKDAGPILPQYIEIMYLNMWRNRSELNQESDVCYAHVTRLLPQTEDTKSPCYQTEYHLNPLSRSLTLQ